MVGILVHGDNHFIVRGPLPDRDAARALIRHWSIIQIAATTGHKRILTTVAYKPRVTMSKVSLLTRSGSLN